MDISGLEWGTVGEWASAAGAVGAIVVALRIANRENSAEAARSIERAQEAAAQRTQERMRMANYVSVWSDNYSPNSGDTGSYRVLNAGRLPITEVEVFYEGVYDGDKVSQISTYLGTIAPGAIGSAGLGEWNAQLSGGYALVTFVDANGGWWERTTDGNLREKFLDQP